MGILVFLALIGVAMAVYPGTTPTRRVGVAFLAIGVAGIVGLEAADALRDMAELALRVRVSVD